MINNINQTTNHYLFKNRVQTLKRYGVLLLFFGLLLSREAKAQDKTLTINEAIKLGIENSKTLKLSQSKIDRAVSQYNQAKDKALPTGNLSYGYSHAEIPANRLSLGPTNLTLPSRADAYIGTVAIQETIFGGGRLKYAQQSTELLTQVARLDAEKDKDQIVYDVISAYYNLYKVLQSQKVVAQNITSVDQQLTQAQRFFDQGIVTKNDVLRFQLQKSNIQLNGIDLESNRKIINYNLDILLGLPESTEIKIDDINEANHTLLPLSGYLDTAMVTRQELRQLDLQNRVAEINIKNIRAEKLPTLGVGANMYYIDAVANPIPQSGSFIDPVTIGATLSWNFGSLWNNKNKVTEARIQREETLINKSVTVDNLKNEVNRNYQNYLSAQDKIKLLETSIAQATENNKILESKYKSNVASVTDRVDAQTLLYQAQINLELAKADAGLAYYTLLKSTGKLNK
ncbi:TolC family protein [Mucilaginibacter paludis]|uniref:Outer membrane efflux protein n=1 Tax=Mucilaginibacter paludis DSM 18603 TaxID=714943 RepID=H1YIF7_9SPHI|nr:TolC family protein [Mucilaginibacter paludis]EHQ27570.1 outer membrane efflux protein [Mucilaginibacter paludis DSM 18603]